MGGVYKNGDDRLRTCIVTATLEHLFERKAIRKYFADWQDDATLAVAYDQACLWDEKPHSVDDATFNVTFARS